MAVSPRAKLQKVPKDVLAHVSNLRHAVSLLTTALGVVDALEQNDKQSEEGIKEMKQGITKAIASGKNELGRFPVKGE